MNELIYQVCIDNFYKFNFQTPEEAVSFAISAKTKQIDKDIDVHINFVEAEDE